MRAALDLTMEERTNSLVPSALSFPISERKRRSWGEERGFCAASSLAFHEEFGFFIASSLTFSSSSFASFERSQFFEDLFAATAFLTSRSSSVLRRTKILGKEEKQALDMAMKVEE